jgi:hypothetical protein
MSKQQAQTIDKQMSAILLYLDCYVVAGCALAWNFQETFGRYYFYDGSGWRHQHLPGMLSPRSEKP